MIISNVFRNLFNKGLILHYYKLSNTKYQFIDMNKRTYNISFNKMDNYQDVENKILNKILK